jgi:prolyl oligopeptidase
MDMLKFHKFGVGKAWTYDFGCADLPEEYPFLKAISPLHNVKSGVKYPSMLLTTADHDDRVSPLHSFKLIAELQHQIGVTSNPALIRIEVDAGHGAGKSTMQIISEQADVCAFWLSAVNFSFPAGKL